MISRTSVPAPAVVAPPDRTRILPRYNEANLLERIEAKLRGGDTITTFIDNLDYNEKGQRTLIAYGNGARTEYTYDPETFRLVHLITTRGNGADASASPTPARRPGPPS